MSALVGAPSALAAGGGASPSGSGAAAPAPTTTATTTTGATVNSGGGGISAPPPGVSTPTRPIVPGAVAKIINGVAYAPSWAPIQVQEAIWAGNQIRRKPYIWGGGHQSFIAAGYDCSGSVSYVLHAAGLLKTPFDSSDFMKWGLKGLGHWITVYTNPGHAFVQIAGIRFDTSAEADSNPPPGSGPRWRPLFQHPQGFSARHFAGL
ncbi:MAG TPA: hypothetical protein VMU39_22205 [Solirubrobacteraceae bacterium]|nr:hypothetical protein [Solirubrobacteraceae bacterium]